MLVRIFNWNFMIDGHWMWHFEGYKEHVLIVGQIFHTTFTLWNNVVLWNVYLRVQDYPSMNALFSDSQGWWIRWANFELMLIGVGSMSCEWSQVLVHLRIDTKDKRYTLSTTYLYICMWHRNFNVVSIGLACDMGLWLTWGAQYL